MRVTEVLPRTGATADAATDEGRAWLAERYLLAGGPFVRLNMVTTLTGAASGADGTSDTLTSRVDRTILGVIRRQSQVVVVGAASVRAEGYIVPRTAHLAVVSRSGRLDGHRFGSPTDNTATPDSADLDRVLLLVPDGVAPDAPSGVRVIHTGPGGDISPAAVIGALTSIGLDRIVCEGGPSLASQFAAAGVVDEFCITVAPRLTPVGQPLMALDSPIDLTTHGMLVDDAGFSYLRLQPRRAGEASG